MINHLKNHPTHVTQLVVDYPHFIGYSDACKLGAGGVWSSGTAQLAPLVWQYQWPQDVQDNLISASNPNGTVTINDLELAGIILNWLALEYSNINLHGCHIGTFCDNASAVSWAYKLRTSASIPAARLLRFLGIRIHARQASSMIPLNIAGTDNLMADIASRAFKAGKYFSAASNLTAYFNSNFPLKDEYWHECLIPKEITSRVISCLRMEPLPMASLIRLPKPGKNTGDTGNNMLPHAAFHFSSIQLQSPTLKKKSSLSLTLRGSGKELTVEEHKLKFKASRMLSRPSPRPSNWLENKVPSTKKRTSTKPT